MDFSAVAVAASQRRAVELGLPCRYVVGELPGAPLRDGCADLVYTGKGALIWLPDLHAWARDVARLLRPGGSLFVYEAHRRCRCGPGTPTSRGPAGPRLLRASARQRHVPGPRRGGAAGTLGEIVTAVVAAGPELRHLAEYPGPFWRPDGVDAAAWRGRLPNAFSLLATRPKLILE